MKICIACSAGGHLTEALQLEKVWLNKKHFFITDKRINALDLKGKKYFILPTRRNHFRFIISFLQSFYIIIKERPSVIISTGAEIGFPALLIGHYLGIKTIYIETMSRLSPSLTGKLCYGKVDHFFVQWEEQKKFFPNAKYYGSVF